MGRLSISMTDDLKTSLYIAAGSIALCILLLSGVVTTLKPLAGDEPHYLVVTNSIISDGDLDLLDDYTTEKAWEDFYNGSLSPHYAPGLHGKHSTRAVGLSYYLIPFYAVGKATDAIPVVTRFGMGILFALFMMQLYLIIRDLSISKGSAAIACVIAGITVPILFYSYSIFPEIPAALLSIVAIRLMLRWDQRTLLNPLFAGAALAILPWLGVKYSVLAVVFGLGIVIYIITSRAPLFRSIGYFALIPLISMVGLALFLWMLYGSFSPEVIYTGVGEGAITTGGFNMQVYGKNTGNPIGSFFRVLLLYLFDQRDGLVFYSPFYLAGIIGILVFTKERRPFALTLISTFVLYWIAYATSAWYSGYAPSARPLLAVLWILVVGCALVFSRIKGQSVRLLIIAAVSYSIAISAVHLLNNHLIYNVIDFATQDHGNQFLASIAGGVDLTSWFPNLVSPHDIHPIPVILFISFAVAAGVLICRDTTAVQTAKQKESSGNLFVVSALLAAAFPVLIVLIASQFALFIAPEDMQFDVDAEPKGVRVVFADSTAYNYETVPFDGIPHHGFWQQGGTTTEFYLVAGAPLTELTIKVHSRVAQKINVQVASEVFELEFKTPSWKECTVPGDLALPWTHRALYPVRISSESGFRPSEINPGSTDTRYLGARIAIFAQQ